MLLGQGWVIDQLFDNKTSEQQIEHFIRTGMPGEAVNMKEPRNPQAEEIVAKTLANEGRLIVEVF